jgi:hypothetical protein
MSSDPSHSTAAGTAERPQAMWPWLLLPLVALTLFFALHRVKQGPAHHATHADESAEMAVSEAGESSP